ncbi:PREDICTED: odorant receptor 13a-like [Atta colombica]|uniref:odorant receptor 13a-like n=1 Tax=Atta colombica TaxID=520822 RepID=UPI00084BCC56|nr:PREDICTED: odorant receptor 13a-like [Atta colombica]
MNRKSEDNKVCKREDIISLEYYIANLLFVLEYACIWPVKSFSPLKVLFSTVATIVFILTNFLLLFSEIVALAMSNDLKIFANIIGAISMHAVGLMKWCYSIWKNREIIDLVRKFIKMLQTFSGPTMFVQCIETLLIICLVSFEASMIKIAIDMESILKLWSLFEYFLCAALQLFIFCFSAAQLEHLGLQIAQSIYSCGWEFVVFKKREKMDFGKQLKDISRLVQTIMIRAQRPIILTGGPFYVLSLETFRVIIGLAMSNSIMLRTISDVNE